MAQGPILGPLRGLAAFSTFFASPLAIRGEETTAVSVAIEQSADRWEDGLRTISPSMNGGAADIELSITCPSLASGRDRCVT